MKIDDIQKYLFVINDLIKNKTSLYTRENRSVIDSSEALIRDAIVLSCFSDACFKVVSENENIVKWLRNISKPSLVQKQSQEMGVMLFEIAAVDKSLKDFSDALSRLYSLCNQGPVLDHSIELVVHKALYVKGDVVNERQAGSWINMLENNDRSKWINLMRSAMCDMPSDVHMDNGGIEHLTWLAFEKKISLEAAKKLVINLNAGDVADLPYVCARHERSDVLKFLEVENIGMEALKNESDFKTIDTAKAHV